MDTHTRVLSVKHTVLHTYTQNNARTYALTRAYVCMHTQCHTHIMYNPHAPTYARTRRVTLIYTQHT